jgi:pimeloyl-ACP methyl ester carboxylesterase
VAPVAHDGLGLAIREAPADGKRILWIHGYTLDSGIWADLWGRLPDWHHIGVDLPGHGQSAPGTAGETLPSLGRRIWAQREGVRHVVALSFGTVVAVQMALEAPAAFATMVLAAPALCGAPGDPGAQRRYEELMRRHAAGRRGADLVEIWTRSPGDVFGGAQRQPALWADLVAVIARHRWTELEDGSMRALTDHFQRPTELPRIRARTLVLTGEDEMPVFRFCAQILVRALPACEGATLPGVGHLCLLEAPGEAARLIASHVGPAVD